MSSNIVSGKWRLLPNHAKNDKGTIHDDNKAIQRGFRRGIVGGPSVAQALSPTLIKIFGEEWLTKGWLSVKFINPVYDDEKIQEIAKIQSKNSIKLQIITKNNRVAMVGNAGIGSLPPWDASQDLQKGADKAFPNIKIGFKFEEIMFEITEDDILLLCQGADESNNSLKNISKNYAPPVIIFNPATKPVQDLVLNHPVDQAGMNAEFAFLIHEPLIINKKYTIKMQIVDKGKGMRTWFWTTQFDVLDDDKVIITARQKFKWFKNN